MALWKQDKILEFQLGRLPWFLRFVGYLIFALAAQSSKVSGLSSCIAFPNGRLFKYSFAQLNFGCMARMELLRP